VKIAVDATLLTGRFSGVEKAILGLIENLMVYARDDTILLYVSRDFDKSVLRRGGKLRRSWFRNRIKLLRIAWNQTILPLSVWMEKVDVFHAAGYVAPLWQPVPTVLSVYDCIALKHPKLCRWSNRHHYRAMLPASVHRSARVIVPTESVKQDLIAATRVSEEKVRVVPLGVSPEFGPIVKNKLKEVRQRYRLPEHFILFVGTLEPKKNVEALLRAYFAMKLDTKPPHRLVLAGRMSWGTGSVVGTITAHQLQDDVQMLGYVPQSDMAALYCLADLFVFPSLTEGFGFPPLEAMACGTPVVASSVPALAEVLGDAARLVDPASIAELKQAMEEITGDESAIDKYRKAGIARARKFSWATTVQKTYAVYEELARERGSG